MVARGLNCSVGLVWTQGPLLEPADGVSLHLITWAEKGDKGVPQRKVRVP